MSNSTLASSSSSSTSSSSIWFPSDEETPGAVVDWSQTWGGQLLANGQISAEPESALPLEEQLAEQLDEREGEIADLNASLAQRDQDLEFLLARHKKLRHKHKKIQAENLELGGELVKTQDELADSRAQAASLQAELDRLKRQFGLGAEKVSSTPGAASGIKIKISLGKRRKVEDEHSAEAKKARKEA